MRQMVRVRRHIEVYLGTDCVRCWAPQVRAGCWVTVSGIIVTMSCKNINDAILPDLLNDKLKCHDDHCTLGSYL